MDNLDTGNSYLLIFDPIYRSLDIEDFLTSPLGGEIYEVIAYDHSSVKLPILLNAMQGNHYKFLKLDEYIKLKSRWKKTKK